MDPLIILSLFSNPSFRHLQNISSFIANLGYIWTSGSRREGKKTSLEEAARRKSHSNKEGAPFHFPSKKHTEALHLSPVPAPSRILLYVNSVYLSSLQGKAASTADSGMRHFSPLPKKGKTGADPVGHGMEALWRHRRASMATRLSLSFLGAFQEPPNEKKTTAILHGAGRASGAAAAAVTTRCSRVITLAVDEGDGPQAN